MGPIGHFLESPILRTTPHQPSHPGRNIFPQWGPLAWILEDSHKYIQIDVFTYYIHACMYGQWWTPGFMTAQWEPTDNGRRGGGGLATFAW